MTQTFTKEEVGPLLDAVSTWRMKLQSITEKAHRGQQPTQLEVMDATGSVEILIAAYDEFAKKHGYPVPEEK